MFKSKSQRRWLWANRPAQAKKWEAETPKSARLPDRASGRTIEERIIIATK